MFILQGVFFSSIDSLNKSLIIPEENNSKSLDKIEKIALLPKI